MRPSASSIIQHKIGNTIISVFPPNLIYEEKIIRIKYLESTISGLLNCEVKITDKSIEDK